MIKFNVRIGGYVLNAAPLPAEFTDIPVVPEFTVTPVVPDPFIGVPVLDVPVIADAVPVVVEYKYVVKEPKPVFG